ncbi:MAG: polymerase beta subunit [Clostridia bacterium]|jgi:DNA polymerase-3 subunit beta|uniref:DNA polymerase III subunit beta n=1 Tax=Petroclostridium xylanilyticum TaxID=1792311 RepID=UPI000B990B51|nr:DNA polymerase III subunit beta [Petroclostridium xylanilyticum]MBZ4646139.1 polymerase beta subunit [Clostridia bacterium]
MKILCDKNILLDGINIVQKAVSPKSALPILEGILLEASENLKLTGNDLELGIECNVEATVERTGSVVLNSKIFGDIVRKLPNDIVHIEVQENNSTYIKCGNSEFTIMGISSAEFPELPKVQKENALVVTQECLRSMIRQTIFAVGTNENKLILTGSCLEVNNNELNMVSVDGYRLALRKETIDTKDSKLSIVIPGKTLNELSKIIREGEEDINIYITTKHVLFEFDNCRIISRLLEGEFLNYKQIIPKEYQLRVKASVKPLIDSIERAALIITSDNQKYPVKLNIKMDKIIISCMTQTGTVQDSVPVETFGDDLEIGFNHKYLLDALKACECDEIYMEFNTSLSPCIIKPIEGEQFIYLVLPVRLRSE